jgi:hypothetical protein
MQQRRLQQLPDTCRGTPKNLVASSWPAVAYAVCASQRTSVELCSAALLELPFGGFRVYGKLFTLNPLNLKASFVHVGRVLACSPASLDIFMQLYEQTSLLQHWGIL